MVQARSALLPTLTCCLPHVLQLSMYRELLQLPQRRSMRQCQGPQDLSRSLGLCDTRLFVSIPSLHVDGLSLSLVSM
jgi:hypothetical protein